jgi:Fe2+ or Zn2+ uptake regulation protein
MNTQHIQKLRAQKLKITPKRQAILDYFIKEDSYLTPKQVWEKLKKNFKHLGYPSIYRNLESFKDCGILVKIQREDRLLCYALCNSHESNHHHHHIVCIKCGKVADVEGCVLSGVKNASGYKVLKHTVQLEGLCPKCV